MASGGPRARIHQSPHFGGRMHSWSPLHTRSSPEQQPQPPFAAPHGPPDIAHEHDAAPPSLWPEWGVHVHSAIWLWVVMSWYGIQNATPDGSLPAACASTNTGAIQSCGCWHAEAITLWCELPGHSRESGG